ncbi:phage tail protein [Aestuariivita sp.]|jgi:hypothetical protein|uniref:phage tail protein n=1 Tax=Aestuariivita sp. TaxID=1872407 RepID=UPI0021707FFB|nr:phage tail protein [Aestuariivita sp.]MCE8009044.1 hypothetical protein [Aestuariivita sp.]
MALDEKRIYELLPAIHRLRDAESGGGALEDLIRVIAKQAEAMEDDIAARYANWFIETCDPWVVPYIADLLDVRLTNDVTANRALPQRAYVANTLAYRRRKGTVPVIEEVVRDTTGWITTAAEHFLDLSVTAHMNHVRHGYPGTLDLRDAAALELTDGAFDPGPRMAEMGRITAGKGRYNIPNIGLFVWKAEAFPLAHVLVRDTDGGVAGRAHLDPLRRDIPLANTPEAERGIESLTREEHTPGLLRPMALHAELDMRRQAIADGRPAPTPQFFTAQPPFRIWVRPTAADPLTEVPVEEVAICHLGDLSADPTDWRRPPPSLDYQPVGGGPSVALPIRVGIDVERGRLALPAGDTAAEIRVSHATLGLGDLGGGPYDRSEALQDIFGARSIDWQVMVTRAEAADNTTIFATLHEAVAAWNALPAGQVGLICMAENAAFEDTLTGADRIELPEGSLLVIAAAGWPDVPVEGGAPGQTVRPLGLYDASGLRPCVIGDLEVIGTAPGGSDTPGEFVLNGLLLDGALAVLDGPGAGLGMLMLDHLTQPPEAGGLAIGLDNEALELVLCRARIGPLSAMDDIAACEITESIIDGDGGAAIDLQDAQVRMERATCIGAVTVERCHASNSIFTDVALARRLQEGCVRFCYVAPGSSLPRRYRCQPDLALDDVPAAQQPAILARIVPSFGALDPVHYAYALPGLRTPPEIAAGADDGAGMGAWGFLALPQRRANARRALDEYLRFGLEAGLIEVT